MKAEHTCILTGPDGSAQVESLRGAAVGFTDHDAPVVAINTRGLSPHQRVTLAHLLAEVIGEVLGTNSHQVH